jgi:hypothetical protein
LGRSIRVTNQSELTAIGCAQLAGIGLEEVSITENESRVYTPNGKMRLDWMKTFSSAVTRLSHSR